MKAAIDIDSVLADTMGMFHKVLKERHGVDFHEDSIYQWDAEKCLLHLTGLHLTSKEYFELFDPTWERWEEIKPTEHFVREFHGRLLDAGLELDVVTYARTAQQVEFKQKWIEKHFAQGVEVVNSNDHATWKHEMDYDIFLDDSPHHVAGAFAKGKVGIVYDKPWNRGLIEGVTCSYRAVSLPAAMNRMRWEVSRADKL